MLGTNAVMVVAILELILAVYSVALIFSTDNKVFKIVHGLFGIFWVVLAVMNIFS
ncbi:MAG: hypothetical protein HFG65_14705 [Hungatella sp.]|nr:hypothetical protein [Hungatella sp.]